MSHPSIAGSFVVVLVALMASVIPARGETPPAQTPPAQTPPAQSSVPVLCGGAKEVSIVIDPGADSGSAQIEFCNPPNSNSATSPVSIQRSSRGLNVSG